MNDELDKWEQIEKAILPPPWRVAINVGDTECEGLFAGDVDIATQDRWGYAHFRGDENRNVDTLNCIAEIRNALPRLLAENRKLRAHIIDTVGEEGLKALFESDKK